MNIARKMTIVEVWMNALWERTRGTSSRTTVVIMKLERMFVRKKLLKWWLDGLRGRVDYIN